jgi:predicted  nucleic acid-binding Zn-ribbon protein
MVGGYRLAYQPAPNELQSQLHRLREREQALIDQLEKLQDEITQVEERLQGENTRKRGRASL